MANGQNGKPEMKLTIDMALDNGGAATLSAYGAVDGLVVARIDLRAITTGNAIELMRAVANALALQTGSLVLAR